MNKRELLKMLVNEEITLSEFKERVKDLELLKTDPLKYFVNKKEWVE